MLTPSIPRCLHPGFGRNRTRQRVFMLRYALLSPFGDFGSSRLTIHCDTPILPLRCTAAWTPSSLVYRWRVGATRLFSLAAPSHPRSPHKIRKKERNATRFSLDNHLVKILTLFPNPGLFETGLSCHRVWSVACRWSGGGRCSRRVEIRATLTGVVRPLHDALGARHVGRQAHPVPQHGLLLRVGRDLVSAVSRP